MKKLLFPLLGCAVLLGSCSKSDNNKLQPVRPLEEVADVVTKMSDARFARYCLDNFDMDRDGLLSMDEAAEVTVLRLPNGYGENGASLNLISLSGIEYFTNLVMLVCSNNLLTELDLSHNQNLEYLDCADNQISELNLARHNALENVYCERNKLNVLTISSSAKYLETLWCHDNELATLDVRNLTNLENLNCSSNRLSMLDLTGCLRLVELQCTFNQLISLQIPSGQLLESIECYVNQLPSLDLSHCPRLKRLECQENKLTSLDLSACPGITLLSCSDNAIVSKLNLLNNPLLTEVYCENNPELYELWLIKDHAYETVEKDTHTVIYWDGDFLIIDGDLSDWNIFQTTDAILPASRPDDADFTNLQKMRVAFDTEYLYFYVEYKSDYYNRNLSLYLDADLDASTGYDCGYWTNSGAEYRIEGSVASYSENAYVYDYNQSQTIAQEGSGVIIGSDPVTLENGNQAIEFSVKRSVLPTLGDSVKIGAYLSNSSWYYRAGILPQGESSSSNGYVQTEMLTVNLK